MGGSGTTNNNKFNKRSMEYNESDFCSLWTQHIRIRNCANLFINEKLAGDYFFNRLNNVLVLISRPSSRKQLEYFQREY